MRYLRHQEDSSLHEMNRLTPMLSKKSMCVFKTGVFQLICIICLQLLFCGIGNAQSKVDSTLLLPSKDMQWWRNAKFGMFVHYGLYSIPGKGEWAMFTEPIDAVDYSMLKNRFECEKFSGQKWVDVAKSAGCKYMVVTAKHHDGFSLFDSKFDDYNSVNSAVKKDLIGEYIQAAHKSDMKVGIYYSPLDWCYPGFFFPEMYRTNAEKMKSKTYTQIRELLTNYGNIDILWYDGGEDNWIGFGGLSYDFEKGWHSRSRGKDYKGQFSWEPLKLNKMVRELQPKIIINPRSGWMGDFEAQEVRLKGKINDRPWELNTTLDGGWGWTPNSAKNTMSLDSCIKLLVTVVCQDGNLLLNVGPKANGEIEPVQVQRMKEIGDFFSKYGESIYNTKGGVFNVKWGGTTLTDKAIYVHIIRMPVDRIIDIPEINRKITNARYMQDNKKVKFAKFGNGIRISDIPTNSKETDIVIKLDLSPK
jgi:alpha-L-fucosidase